MSISITSLEKSVNTLAKKLNKQGLETDVYTFSSGGQSELGASYVELTAEDDKRDIYVNVTFLANGYGAIRQDEIGDWGMKWSEMKKEFLSRLEKELKND